MRSLVAIAAVLLLFLASLPAFSVTAQNGSLLDLLPAADDIGPGFVVVDHRSRTLAEQATGFANADEAARLLAGWEWQDNAFQVFQAAELTAAGAPVATIDISLTRFASAEGAAAAMPYFLQDRVAVLGQGEAQNLNQQTIGDESRVVTGDVEGGSDTTFYVRAGGLLARISATTLSGASATSPEAIAQGIIDRAAPSSPPVMVLQRAVEELPETLPLAHAACFRVDGEGDLDLPAVVSRLATGSDTAATLEALGWEAGVYRQFACDPPPGRAGWVDLSLHRFPDAATAADAVTFFAESRGRGMDLEPAPALDLGESNAALTGPAVNGTEYTLYATRGPLLFAITGVAPSGDPRPDVEEIAAALLASNAPEQAPMPVEEVPTSTPFTLDVAAPTVAPLPTATPFPTPLPMPTDIPVPTATFPPAPTPVPTAMAIPTEPPPPTVAPTPMPTTVPTLIPVAVPPQPTTAAGPLPTPTPRVIRIPTPAGG